MPSLYSIFSSLRSSIVPPWEKPTLLKDFFLSLLFSLSPYCMALVNDIYSTHVCTCVLVGLHFHLAAGGSHGVHARRRHQGSSPLCALGNHHGALGPDRANLSENGPPRLGLENGK